MTLLRYVTRKKCKTVNNTLPEIFVILRILEIYILKILCPQGFCIFNQIQASSSIPMKKNKFEIREKHTSHSPAFPSWAGERVARTSLKPTERPLCMCLYGGHHKAIMRKAPKWPAAGLSVNIMNNYNNSIVSVRDRDWTQWTNWVQCEIGH